jgi:two-component system OmpR family sensor kinase
MHPADGFANQGSWRVYSAHLNDKSLVIQVGENLDHRFVAVTETTLAMVTPILILLPVLLMLIHRALNRVLVPVTTFSREIEDRGSANLSDVPVSGLPTEFDAIRNKLNALLERLRAALDAERSFSANSAHQLRTPVAAALAQSEMLERELNTEVDRERVKKLSDALRRLGRVVEKLLQLARADLDTKSVDENVDPAGLLKLVLSDYTTPLSDRKVIITGSEYAKPVKMDADSLGIMFQNIIENAISYSTPGTPIAFEFDRYGGLTVSNDCEALPPEILPQLGERFVRGSTHTRGSGLGLAIVKSLARKSGIDLNIRSPYRQLHRGFAIELQFPY